MNIFNSILIL